MVVEIHAKTFRNVFANFCIVKLQNFCKKNETKKGWSGPDSNPQTAAWEVLPFATYGLLTP